MPVTPFKIPDTLQTVDKKIVMSVIEDLIEYDLLPDNPDIKYSEVIKKIRRKSDNEGSTGLDKTLLGDNVLSIEVSKKNLADIIHGKRGKRLQRDKIFYDRSIGFNCSAIYTDVEFRMNLVYSSSSINKLILIKQGITDRASEGNMNILHDVNFTFAIPDELSELIVAIHTRKEKVMPYDISIKEYLADISDDGVVTQFTRDGTHPRLVVDEIQTGILGVLVGDYHLDIIDNEDGTYSLEMEYVFVANRPHMFHVHYLPMVHNQLLPRKYLDVTPPERKGKQSSIEPLTRLGLDKQQRAFDKAEVSFPILTPIFNDNVLDYTMVGFMPIIQALCSVEDDGKTLLNLKELGNVHLDERVIAFFEAGEYQHLTTINDSLFQVRLFKNGKISHFGDLSVDANLNIISNKDLNLRDYHHVVIMMNTELEHVSDGAITNAIKHEGILDITLNTVNELDNLFANTRDGILGYQFNEGNKISALSTTRQIRTFLRRILSVSNKRRSGMPVSTQGLDNTIIKMDKSDIGKLVGDFSVMRSTINARRQ